MTKSALPDGFSAAAVAAGIKQGDAPDLGLVVADEPRPMASLFTRSQLTGAHVQLCREHLGRSMHQVRAVLVNSGNANCATGDEGLDDARRIARRLAELLGCPVEQVLFLSTGVIGARLPVDRILGSLQRLCEGLSPDGLPAFAHAILTTDTRAKLASAHGEDTDGTAFHVTGVAKGSGMIHPDMATMLSFLFTDGQSPSDMQFLLRALADRSYHRLSVDGDTSPNDTVLLWYNEGRWLRSETDEEGLERDPFEQALTTVCQDLCKQIAADGEGASRLVTVQVRGMASERDAAQLGRTIAASPLVKTAITGRDPNWGRLLSAAARCGIPFSVEQAKVWIGDAELFSHGRPHPENEARAHTHLETEDAVVLGIDLALGPYEADIWTCDLTAEYVRINAEYRT